MMKLQRLRSVVACASAAFALIACGSGGDDAPFVPPTSPPPGGGGPPIIVPDTDTPTLLVEATGAETLHHHLLAGDASKVVFVATDDTLELNWQLFSVDLGTSALTEVTAEDEDVGVVNFRQFDITGNAGDVVFQTEADLTGNNPTEDRNIFVRSTDGTNQTVQVTDSTTFNAFDDPKISGNGSLVVFVSDFNFFGTLNPLGERHIFSMNADGTGLARVTLLPLNPTSLALSDDGRLIAFESMANPLGSNNDGSQEIFVIETDGAPLMQLTSSAGTSSRPRLSDDGNFVVFTSNGQLLPGANPDGGLEVYVALTNGTGTFQISDGIGSSGGFAGLPGSLDISGNGSYVVFGSNADLTGENAARENTIYWARSDGTSLTQLLRTGTVPPGVLSREARDPSFNDDGSVIAFRSSVAYSDDATVNNLDKLYWINRQ